MARPIQLYFAPSSTTALLGTTTTTGGAQTSVGLTNPYPYQFTNLQRLITFTSTDNLSAVNITITGEDMWGNTISEVLAGPNPTSTSVNQYAQITNIACSAALTNFSIGTGSSGTFIWAKINQFNVAPNTTIQAEVTGTVNYSVNQTSDIYEYYTYVGVNPTFNYPKAILLGNNPINVANASTVGTLTVPTTANLRAGQVFSIQGAAAGSGQSVTQINGIFTIVTIASSTTLTYTAATNGNGGAGGGATVYFIPGLPTSFAVTAALTAATTNQIYNLNSPAYALQGVINANSTGSLTLTFLQQGID
jgi:hypothetical protein